MMRMASLACPQPERTTLTLAHAPLAFDSQDGLSREAPADAFPSVSSAPGWTTLTLAFRRFHAPRASPRQLSPG